MSAQGGWIRFVLAGLFCLAAWPAWGDRASAAADFSKGAFYGKVVDAASGQPVADATVALQDRSGKVVAWTRTNAQGKYAIAADSLKLLQLRPSRRRGLLAQLVRGAGKVVNAPVKAASAVVSGAASVVKEVDPVNTAKSAAVSGVSGSPAPVVSQVTGGALNAVGEKAEKRAKENAVKAVLGERQASPKKKRDALVPGEVVIAVSAPNYKEARGQAGAYWLEPPARDQGQPVGPRAWLETVKLAPAGSDKKSEIEDAAVLLAEPHMEPSLAPAGTAVKISVKLQAREAPASNIRVFAREDKKRKVVELKAQGDNVFTGELALDPKTPVGDTSVTLVALRAEPVEVDLRESKEDPLLHLAERLDDLDADKPYEFDPRIMASENRLDLTLTVLDPKRATPPTGAAAPATPPVAAPPAKPAAPPAPPAQPDQPK
jgi:hypothetical protein